MSNRRNTLVMRTYPPAYAFAFLGLGVAIVTDALMAYLLLFYVGCLGIGFHLGFGLRAYRVMFPELSWWGVVRCRAPLPGEPYPRLSLSVGWVGSLVGVVGSCWVGVRLLVDGSGWAVVWVLVANGWAVALGWWWERPESIVRHRSAVTEAVVSPAARVTMPVVDVGSDPGWPGWGFVPGVKRPGIRGGSVP